MATREINRKAQHYTQLDLEPELISVPEEDSRTRGRSIERLRILWERRALLYRWAVIGFVVSTIVAFLIPSRYTTTTRLMPPDQAGQGLASMVAALGKSSEIGSLGTELFGVKTSGDLFVGVLKSESVENAVINKNNLLKVYGVRRWEDARKQLESRTDVSADRKSGIITVKATDKSPERAAAIGREYVEQLNHVVINLDTSAAHRERLFLENRLNEVQVDLESAEKDFSQFASKNVALDVKEQGRAMIGAAGQLEGELIAAQTELEGLRQIYTNNNVRVRSVQARIEEYKRQLQKMGGQPPAQNGQPSDIATDTAQSPDLYPSIRQLPILGVTWADLYRRTKVEEAVFETLTKQYEMARVEEAREVPSVKVLDAAAVPEKKSFPPRLLLILFGTTLALSLAAFAAITSARWETLDSSDPRRALVQEVFQTIEQHPWATRTLRFVNKRSTTVAPSASHSTSSERGEKSDDGLE
jgi:capsule polysaccharide export protein KpsE/RkpR